MKQDRLEKMFKGWFVGGFIPSAYTTNVCEVAVKRYRPGDKESCHYHKVATEITLVLSGKVLMFDKVWNEGDIITVNTGESTSFEALTEVTIVVVKVPGAVDDKYYIEK